MRAHQGGFWMISALLGIACGGTGSSVDEDMANDEALASCARLPITVSASGDDGNVANNVLDRNYATRWSSYGVGQFLTADLGTPKALCAVQIAWYQGDLRTNDFVISASSDGSAFTPIYSGKSSGRTTRLEAYPVSATTRYVRVTVDGNSLNSWASITELRVGGGGAVDASAPPPPPTSSSPPPPPPPPATDPPPRCDRTLAPGADLAAAVTSAVAGTTICLEAGKYAPAKLTKVVKASDVTLRSASGATATVDLTISGSGHLRLQSLTIAGLDMRDGGKNLSVVGNTFTGQLLVTGGSSDASVVIDGNTFDGIDVCDQCYEGRFQLYDGLGVTITNNHFGKAGESDGIQIGGSGAVVGPGNVFEGLIQGSYGRHVDAIQLYGSTNSTIVGNYFVGDTVFIGEYDGGSNENFVDNVFVDPVGNDQPVIIGSIEGGSFAHNTVRGNFVVAQGAKSGMPRVRNFAYRNNIFDGSEISDRGDQPGCVSGCVYEYNLFSSKANARGTNVLVGVPTYVGGAKPAAWSGYRLVAVPPSLGVRAGSDGKDLGATWFGP